MTRPRSIRISDEDWAEIERLAGREGVSVSEYMRGLALAPADARRLLQRLMRAREMIDRAIQILRSV